jgi:predicted NAD/FAD-binding protein
MDDLETGDLVRIAIIGTGIAGMVAAYLLAPNHDVAIFEANDYIGGHTHTIDVQAAGRTYAVDTGFIVFNESTYPNFITLLKRLGVTWQPTNMSFSVQDGATGLEFGFRTLRSVFAQPQNVVRPAFLRLLWDIWRFRRESGELARDETYRVCLGAYLASKGYSRAFTDQFLLPLSSALWSADPRDLSEFPARYLADFFQRHRFLNLSGKIKWQVIRGGSRSYVGPLTRPYRDRVRLKAPVAWVKRDSEGVEIKALGGEIEHFDRVVIAAHSDQALRLLADPSEREQEILGAFPYQINSTILHTDATVLPRRRAAWASWNYYLPRQLQERATLTYHMNRLQCLSAPMEFCVTLNRDQDIDQTRVIKKLIYHHPVYRREAPSAQKRWAEINGVNRTYFCGAYWGYGFHEDGVVSALQVCREFGKIL